MSEDISAPFSSEGKENQSWYENRIKAMWGGLYEMLHRPPRVLAQGDLQKALHETLVWCANAICDFENEHISLALPEKMRELAVAYGAIESAQDYPISGPKLSAIQFKNLKSMFEEVPPIEMIEWKGDSEPFLSTVLHEVLEAHKNANARGSRSRRRGSTLPAASKAKHDRKSAEDNEDANETITVHKGSARALVASRNADLGTPDISMLFTSSSDDESSVEQEACESCKRLGYACKPADPAEPSWKADGTMRKTRGRTVCQRCRSGKHKCIRGGIEVRDGTSMRSRKGKAVVSGQPQPQSTLEPQNAIASSSSADRNLSIDVRAGKKRKADTGETLPSATSTSATSHGQVEVLIPSRAQTRVNDVILRYENIRPVGQEYIDAVAERLQAAFNERFDRLENALTSSGFIFGEKE